MTRLERLAILHTNDLHSHFENWPKVKHYLLTKRQQLQKAGYQVYTFDAGDEIDRWHPLTDATNGQANIKALNSIHYDAVTIGNNEGLNNDHPILNHLYDHANFPVVLDNIFDPKTGKLPNWAHEAVKFTTPAGTRIVVLGMTRAYDNGYHALHWDDRHIPEILPPLIKKYQPQADMMILISHLGVSLDRKIAQKYPQLDLIIGGHSHHIFMHGEKDNHSLLVAARKFGWYVGYVKMQLDHHQIKKEVAGVVHTKDLPAQPDNDAQVKAYYDQGTQMLKNDKIADIPQDFVKKPHAGQTNIITEGLHAIEERTNTRAAMLNSGMFVHDLPKGIVNMSQIHDMLPHSSFPMRCTLSGLGLWALVRDVRKNAYFLSRLDANPIGMGFRGHQFGHTYFDQIDFDPKTQTVYYCGKPVDKHKHYTIGMLDYYDFTPFYPAVAIFGKNQILHDKFLRVIFAEYLKKHYPIQK